MGKQKKYILIGVLVVVLLAAGWYFLYYKPKSGFDWAYQWFQTNGNIATVTSGGGAELIDQCAADAAAAGVVVSLETIMAAYYQWQADNGLHLPENVSDRQGTDPIDYGEHYNIVASGDYGPQSITDR